MTSPTLDFWLEFGSTYTYLTAMRIDEHASSRGIEVRWRPFLLGPVFKARGWSDLPINIQKAKARYMWRDVERRAARHELPFQRPSRFPPNGLLAARVATAMSGNDARDFMRAAFRATFVEDVDIGTREVIGEILAAIGQDPDPILEQATSQPVKDALRASTDEAISLGIFGAPSFMAAGELFWGDDRLEDAVDWACGQPH